MPQIQLQHIVSCSSEDKNNPADNLLKPEGTHKWKCATAGEKSISVVIQFEKASKIQAIDIGNEGSAFVEVLVGRSTANTDHDYQVLLVASSFMTPLDARSGTNRTSVRMFDSSHLNSTLSNEKWDRVKIVCSQPFNNTNTYGLSFIKFHCPGDTGEKDNAKLTQQKLGFFKMKIDDADVDVKAGSLFATRSKLHVLPTSSSPIGAAAIRAASKQTAESISKPSLTESVPKASTSSSAASKPPASASPNPSTDGHDTAIKTEPTPSQNQDKRKHRLSDDQSDDGDVIKPTLRKQSTSLGSVASKNSDMGNRALPLKKTKSEPVKDSPSKEFSKLMEHVVFVLSGFQNPYRGELRDRALAMGATYKPDWGKGCTHLVCAFPNTPKYNQVKSRGKIVDKKWIQDCYKQKQLLPWRKYRLGDAESPDEDSEEEVTVNTPVSRKNSSSMKHEEEVLPGSAPKSSCDVAVPATLQSEDDGSRGGGDSKHSDNDDNGGDGDSKYGWDEDSKYGGETDSGEDTDDAIKRIKIKQSDSGATKQPGMRPSSSAAKDDTDLYGADTDEDEKPGCSKTLVTMEVDSDTNSGLPELPDFFTDKLFFIYGEMPDPERRLMRRYITAYNGSLEEYMSEKINYVVTSSKWDSNFDDALSENPNLVFVKPKWIHMCHEKGFLVPHQPYIVVPDS